MMRRFELHRDTDETGVSGTGIVAEGVQWDDGSCAMRWRTATTSTAIYASAEAVVAIHGHGGKTRLVWLDEVAGYPDGDDLVALCVMCFGGPPYEGIGHCIDCGAGSSSIMIPRWAAKGIRRHDELRIATSEQHRHRAEQLTETLRVVRLGMARRATEAFDALLVGRPAVDLAPPDHEPAAVTVNKQGDGFTIGGVTVRACRDCGVLITGGPTRCVDCAIVELRRG